MLCGIIAAPVAVASFQAVVGLGLAGRAALPTVDGSPTNAFSVVVKFTAQGELETRCKFLFEPLQRMIDAKEISAAEIILMEGHEETFIEDETMRTKIRYLSRGYIREVYIDLARRRPTA